MHGLDVDATKSYALAVRAVETAAVEVVQPKNSGATLGTVLGQMQADGRVSTAAQ